MKKRARSAPKRRKTTSRTAPSASSVRKLRDRVTELEETIAAIRGGEVDALLVSMDGQDQVFTLRGAETPYRLLVEQMSEGALTVDQSGTILYANRAFAEMVGVPLERVIGSSLLSFIAAGQMTKVRDLLRAGRPAIRELTLNVGGTPLSVQISISPLPEGAAGTCVLITDLTAQKRVEFAAAGERKHRFMMSLNQASSEPADWATLAEAFVRVIGQHFGVSRCVLARIEADGTGWDVESEYAHGVPAIRGRHAADELGPPDFLADLNMGKDIAVTDVHADPRLGKSRDALSAMLVRSLLYVPHPPDGNPVIFLMVADTAARAWTTEDLALLEQAAERIWTSLRAAHTADAILRRENRYRSLVDATTSIVWTTNADGAFIEPQFSWENYTGQPFETHRNLGWLDAIHPDDREGFQHVWNAARQSGTVYRSEGRLWHAMSQSYRQFVARAAPVIDVGGRIHEWVGTCTDVAEQHAAEEALRIAQLEILQGERVARTESERANRLKDEFLATMSHELRTPLNAILGWASLIVGAAARGENVTKGLDTILRNAKAQAQMIEDLLDMSRITTGKVQLDVQHVNLPAIIEAAVDSVRPAAKAKGVRIQHLIDASAGRINGDPNRLQQVVWNLLTNAVKFTPKGGRIQVLLERVNSHAEISVSDSGQGISTEFLPFVFDRFRQADASTTRRHGGLGLGLSIVKTLVEMHGGTVRAKSAGEDQGATFVVQLPLALDRQDTIPLDGAMPRPDVTPVDLNQNDRQLLNGVKVVFVDDEPDSRELVQRVLGEYGAQVWTAKSSDEARQVFSEVRPDVLVSDIGMPDHDGYDLIRAIRELPESQGGRTPAAAVTALARSEDRRRALLAGYHTHVAKPVEPAELVAVVASLAGRTGHSGPT